MGSKGGGPSNVTSTQTPQVPGWLQGAAQNYLGSVQGLTYNSPYSYLSYNPLMNPSVAPFTPTQLQGMQQITGANPAYASAINSGIADAQRLMSGANFGSVPQVSAGSASAGSAGFTPSNINIPGMVGNVGAGMATMPLAAQNFAQAQQAQAVPKGKPFLGFRRGAVEFSTNFGGLSLFQRRIGAHHTFARRACAIL